MLEKFLKKSSWTDFAISLIFVLFGIFLIASPEAVISVISIVLGAIFIVLGLFRLIDYFSTESKENFILAMAVVAIIIGIIIMFCSDVIMSVFRIIIAIWIIYSGIMNLQTVIVWKDFKSRLWLLSLLLSIVMIIGGIYVLSNAGAILQIIGVIIVSYGVIEIIENVIFIKKIDNYIN